MNYMTVEVYSRHYSVTAYFYSIQRCNAYLSRHPSEGVIKVSGKRIYVANNSDIGR